MAQRSMERRPQIELNVSCSALHRALGPAGTPATLAFSFNALTVTTPTGSVRVSARTVITSAAGIETAGLRPRDADALRCATNGPEATVNLTADPLTLTLRHHDVSVTTGRW